MAKTIESAPAVAPGAYPIAEYLDLQKKPNGVAAAAILAAGIGALVLGLMVITTEAIPSWKDAVNFVKPVGPLSGKTDIMVAAYAIALVALVVMWRNKAVNFARVWTASLVLLALGLLGTFPLFYELFTAH